MSVENDILAYHTIFCTYGFWLPNDPRGSQSIEVRAANLRRFGPATKTLETVSVAALSHDFEVRRIAKEALRYPEVVFDGHQALSVIQGFGEMVRKSNYVVHACSIMPSHIHMVIMRHRYAIEQVKLRAPIWKKELYADGTAQWRANEAEVRG